jgi:S1-C subfamily serine protease
MMLLLLGLGALTPSGVLSGQVVAEPQSSQPAAPTTAPAPVSASARRAYEQARAQLLQVRTLLKGQDSQASVGSGFLVSDEGHIITNYHVVSSAALEPERYRLIYSTADRTEGPLQLLAFDAIHDLALVKPANPAPLAGRTPLRFRSRADGLAQGERIYSLGNPLDVGFAVIEGTYNGLVERSFYDTIFFAGSLNAGVSGGPTLDDHGQVIGINVAARRDGEQVSFLVPAMFAEDLLQRARQAPPITAPAHAELTKQLMTHQAELTTRFLAQPWRNAGHAQYAIPLPQEQFMRCWGSSTAADVKGLEYEQSRCRMESSIFVSGWLTTGSLSVRHEAYDGRKLGALRFATQYSAAFANESFDDHSDKHRTVPQCHERYIDRGGLPMRAVLCMRAYKKLTGLYDLSVLVATVDAPISGVQGRFDAEGVSFDNALKLSDHYLKGFGRASKQTAAAAAAPQTVTGGAR